MLLNLRIQNFAIIDTVDIELHSGFTVLTGETGAGKSILIDALMVALGAKASVNLVRSGAATAQVEALFDIRTQPLIQQRLAERHLIGDCPEHLLIRRVIGPRKKGKILVNGHLTTVATLVALVQGLVDISGQHEQQSLLAQDNHVGILDAFGGHQDILNRYQSAYRSWSLLRREKSEQEKAIAENLNREDFIRFQCQEINDLAPKADELDALSKACARLAHAEKLQRVAASAELQLYGGDDSAFDKLNAVETDLQTLTSIEQGFSSCVEQLGEARGHIEDVANQLRRYVDRIEVDPQKLEALQSRHDALLRLVRKHGGDLEQVLEKQQTLQMELTQLQTSTLRMQSLDEDIESAWQAVVSQAQRLTESRHLAAQALDHAIVTEAADMELENAVFQTQIQTMPKGSDASSYSSLGAEQVHFLWSANPGETPKPLTKIISGGELSRLMLAMKRVLCHQDLVSVYVFDEVDTGVGGRAADSIGRKIKRVASQGRQALAITHLAPIAARADSHLRVSKHTVDGRTVSLIKPLSSSERREEIARMIDGGKITQATRQAARAMLQRCRQAKPSRATTQARLTP